MDAVGPTADRLAAATSAAAKSSSGGDAAADADNRDVSTGASGEAPKRPKGAALRALAAQVLLLCSCAAA